MGLAEAVAAELGAELVVRGDEAGRWQKDWTGKYPASPLAVLRPRSTAQVSRIMAMASGSGTPVVPVGGLTNVTGAVQTSGIMLSLDRMNRVREVRPGARRAVAEAGVVLSTLHEAVEAEGMVFPLFFGARGSAMLGGALATNAGGSNVLRYGNARDLCLGLEAVLADGTIVDVMNPLHKDNTGYDLRHLLIGSEGTLGIITAASLKLFPRPRAYATAMVAMADIPAALALLNRLQEASGGAVEAFEYMPRKYVETHVRLAHGREPFERGHPVNILVELASADPEEATPGPDGQVPLAGRLMDVLAEAMERGEVQDAVIAASEGQRREMWARREAAAEITFVRPHIVDCDISLPLDRLAEFFPVMEAELARLDAQAEDFYVAHLGDGNIHYTVYPGSGDDALHGQIRAAVDKVATDLGGSFSAEHGVGQSKLASMGTLKDPGALKAMRAIKAALDPQGLLNPGKVLPE